jgi:hypothetical protein
MKMLRSSLKFLPVILPLVMFSSCEDNTPGATSITKETLSGYAQKGPYLVGTSISLTDLTKKLDQTGKVYTSSISNNMGAFEISNIALSSGYAEINANGFYFNELLGENSSAQLSLSAVSDIRDKSTLNVNLLAHLEKDRLLKLASGGASFAEAKKQAQEEVLDVFLIEKDDIAESELLDIAREGDDNAILLAVSVILQGHLSVADMSELIGKLNADLKEDVILNDTVIGTALINNARLANLVQVRKNLEDRYAELGLDASIPDFEKYVEAFVENSGYTFDLFPTYPETSEYGKNVLYLEQDTFSASDDLSLAANLPEGTSLMIRLKGGLWYYRVMPRGPKNWDVSIYDHDKKEQEFTAMSPGESCDLSIQFHVPVGGQEQFTIEYYENSNVSLTHSREITVIDYQNAGNDDIIFPELGAYGTNILGMESDTLKLETGVTYSLAADFPGYDEASLSVSLYFSDPGLYTIDTSDILVWQIIRQEEEILELFASGKALQPDMPIEFLKPGILDILVGETHKMCDIQ